MAKFKDSMPQDAVPTGPVPLGGTANVLDRSIGSIIAETRHLSADQIERILAYQREKNLRFGEAAIALGFASTDDVLFALAQQFHYPYAPQADDNKLGAELVTLNQPFSQQAEVFRGIRSQLTMRFNGEDRNRRALAVISPDSGDGKTYFAANLAVTLAQLGGRTLLIDADLRGPRLHELFNVSNSAGLSSVLSGRAEAQVIQPVASVPSLFVLPAGPTPPNPMELVERPAFGLLIREVLLKFDHVVVDTPAGVYGADCTVVAARCGAALLLARKNQSQVAALQDMLAILKASPAQVAGVIVNEH